MPIEIEPIVASTRDLERDAGAVEETQELVAAERAVGAEDQERRPAEPVRHAAERPDRRAERRQRGVELVVRAVAAGSARRSARR